MISRLESGKAKVRLWLHTTLDCKDVKKWKVQLQSFMASSESVQGSLKHQRLKEPKLVQLYKVLNK